MNPADVGRNRILSGRRLRVCVLARIEYSSERTPDRSGGRSSDRCADVAQLVEHHLAKVRVAGSNPVVRSEARLCGRLAAGEARSYGGVAEWLRQGPAKPCTRVRFPSPPLSQAPNQAKLVFGHQDRHSSPEGKLMSTSRSPFSGRLGSRRRPGGGLSVRLRSRTGKVVLHQSSTRHILICSQT